MKIMIMTDMEGCAGILNHDNWVMPEGKYYEKGKRLLPEEVNCAISGIFFDGPVYLPCHCPHCRDKFPKWYGIEMGETKKELLDLRLKFSDLKIGKVHGKLKIVDAFAKISSFRQNRIGRFAFEKYVEFVERAKQMSDPVAIMVLFFLPTHDVFPNINKIATSKHK